LAYAGDGWCAPDSRLSSQGRLCLGGIHSPQVGSVSHLDSLAIGIHINWTLRHAHEKQAVIATAFDSWRQVTSAIGVTPRPSEWGFRNRKPTARKQRTGSRKKTRHETQNIVRTQGVSSLRHSGIEHIGCQSNARQVFLVDARRDSFFRADTLRQIDEQDFARIRAQYETPVM
jgi:hypothetical protein